MNFEGCIKISNKKFYNFHTHLLWGANKKNIRCPFLFFINTHLFFSVKLYWFIFWLNSIWCFSGWSSRRVLWCRGQCEIWSPHGLHHHHDVMEHSWVWKANGCKWRAWPCNGSCQMGHRLPHKSSPWAKRLLWGGGSLPFFPSSSLFSTQYSTIFSSVFYLCSCLTFSFFSCCKVSFTFFGSDSNARTHYLYLLFPCLFHLWLRIFEFQKLPH